MTKKSNNAEFYIDDIENIREELNWRVKIAYTSNLTVFPSLTGLATFLLSKELDIDNYYVVACTLSLVLSMYINLQVFNRMVEKKIEAYILTVQKKLRKEYKLHSHSWISFLYGEPSRFSIVGHLSLFYQYILPNIISTVVLLIPYFKLGIDNLNKFFLFLYLFAVILNILSYVLIFSFLYYFKDIRRQHYLFYKKNTNNE
jgi:hypothetical protein